MARKGRRHSRQSRPESVYTKQPAPGEVVIRDQTGYRYGYGAMYDGPVAVALPDDVADPDTPKASGVIELPRHLRPSRPIPFDLDNWIDRRAVYGRVLEDGTPDDVRWFIDVEKLAEMWDRIMVSDYVQAVWEPWLHENGYLP